MQATDRSTPKEWTDQVRREYVNDINSQGPFAVKVRAWGDTHPVADQLGLPYWCQEPTRTMADPAIEFAYGGLDFASICSAVKTMNMWYWSSVNERVVGALRAAGLKAESEDDIELDILTRPVAKA